MPNESYDAAFREAAALASSTNVMLDTIGVSHSSTDSIYLVNNLEDLTRSLEGGGIVTFLASSFGFVLPKTGISGIQDLGLVFSNINREIFDFLELIDGSTEPVMITYRVYDSSGVDTDTPNNDPPIILTLTDVEIDAFEIRARASFNNVVNAKYPNEYYDRQRFPSLAG